MKKFINKFVDAGTIRMLNFRSNLKILYPPMEEKQYIDF